MKKLTFVLAVVAGLAFAFKPAELKMKLDASKSKVMWFAEKVTGKHNGGITVKSGDVILKDGNLTGGTFVMDMTSISCADLEGEWNQKLVGHLKSDDFFSVEKNPTSTFTITKVAALAGDKAGNTHTISGKMTIKGITNEISFPAKVGVTADAITAKGKAVLDRTKWDIKYGSKSFFESIGDKAIYDEFTIEFDVTAKK